MPKRLKLAAANPAAAEQQVVFRKSLRLHLPMMVSRLVLNLKLRRTADQVQRGLGSLGVIREISHSGDDRGADTGEKGPVRQHVAQRVHQLWRIRRQRHVGRDVGFCGGAYTAIHQVVHEVDAFDGGRAVEDPELWSEQSRAGNTVIRRIEVEYG